METMHGHFNIFGLHAVRTLSHHLLLTLNEHMHGILHMCAHVSLPHTTYMYMECFNIISLDITWRYVLAYCTL